MQNLKVCRSTISKLYINQYSSTEACYTRTSPQLRFVNEPQLRNIVHSNSFIFHHNSQLKSLLEPVHSWNSTRPDCHCVANPNSLSLLFSSLSIFLSTIRWQQLCNSRDFYEWLRFLQSDATVHGLRFSKLSAILCRWWSLVHAVSDW